MSNLQQHDLVDGGTTHERNDDRTSQAVPETESTHSIDDNGDNRKRRHRSTDQKHHRHRSHDSDSKHHRSSKQKKSSKKRRRDYSDDSCSDSDASESNTSTSSSSSDENDSHSSESYRRRDKRHRKDRKKRDHDDDDDRKKKHKKNKDKHLDSKKEKKKKSKKKKHRKERRSSDDVNHSTVDAQATTTNSVPTFGQYGIIKASDMNKMQRSFEIWLSEVRGIHLSSSNIPRYELQEYFDTYREDYNTATLPHIKYYNYDKWEQEEHDKQKKEILQSSKTGNTMLNDERNHNLELQRIAKQKEHESLQLIAASMNSNKVKDMQHQKELQIQMQMAYKLGNHETYRKLKEKLQPPDK